MLQASPRKPNKYLMFSLIIYFQAAFIFLNIIILLLKLYEILLNYRLRKTKYNSNCSGHAFNALLALQL